MTYTNPWLYKESHLTDEDAVGQVGFVYLITNLATGRKYIGKKRLFFVKTKTVKKKKKREKIPSDWKEYYGSNKELQLDVEKLGVDNFKREILYLCSTLGQCNYYEAYEQFIRHALLRPEEFYNGNIMCRIHSTHCKGINL